MKNILPLLALFCIGFVTVPAARAGVSPLGIAIIPPVQFPPTDFSVTGARASVLWGEQRYVYGFDLGLVGNMTQNGFGGIAAAGVFNYNKGIATVVGLQFAGAANVNINKASIVGFQVSAGVNSNVAESTVVGFQLAGLANLSGHTKVYGAQVGLVNTAGDVYGFQVGLYNSARSLHGIQIGLLNNNAAGPFSYAPILNVGF